MKNRRTLQIAGLSILGLLLLLLLAVLLLLYSPAAQRSVAQYGARYLADKLRTRVEIGSLRLHFPDHLVLEKVFLGDDSGDTLARLEYLKVEMDMWDLLQNRVVVRSLLVSDAHLRLIQHGDRWNYTFISEAFNTGSSGSSSSIQVDVKDAKVLLEHFQFDWQNNTDTLAFGLLTDSLHATMDALELDPFALSIRHINDQNLSLRYQKGLPPPRRSKVFNPAYIALQAMQLDAENLLIRPNNITASIEQLTAQEPGGLTLHHTRGHLSFIQNRLGLQTFDLQWNDSRLQGSAALTLNDRLDFRAGTLNGKIRVADALYFAPQAALQRDSNRVVQLEFTGYGSRDSIQAKRLLVDAGPDVYLDMQGALYNPTNIRALSVDLQIRRLHAELGAIAAFLPEGRLPQSLRTNDQFDLSGSMQGSMQQLEFHLQPVYGIFTQKMPLKAELDGRLFDLTDVRRARGQVQIQRMELPGEVVQALLPKGVLPENVHIPEQTQVSGQVSGDMQRLSGQLRLAFKSNGPNNHADIDFVLDAWRTANPQYAVTIRDMVVDSALLAGVYIDTVLTKYMRVPRALKAQVKLQNNGEGLKMGVTLRTTDSVFVSAVYSQEGTHMLVRIDTAQLLPASILQPAFLASLGIKPDQVLDMNGNIDLDSVRNMTFEGQIHALETPSLRLQDIRLDGKYFPANSMLSGLAFQTIYRHAVPLGNPPLVSEGRLKMLIDHFQMDSAGLGPAISGALYADSLRWRRDTVLVKPGAVAAHVDASRRFSSLDIRSDWLSADMSAHLNLKTWPVALGKLLQAQLASVDTPYVHLPNWGNSTDSLRLEMAILQPNLFDRGLIPGLSNLDSMRLEAALRQGVLRAQLTADTLYYAGQQIQQLAAYSTLDTAGLDFSVASTAIKIQSQQLWETLRLEGTLERGVLQGDVVLRDSFDLQRIHLGGRMENRGYWKGQLDTAVVLQYQEWRIFPNNHFGFPPDAPFELANFGLQKDDQLLVVDGDLVNDLQLRVNNIDLSLLSEIIPVGVPSLEGLLDGVLHFDSLKTQPVMDADMRVAGLVLEDQVVGDLSLIILPGATDRFNIRAALSGPNTATAEGFYDAVNNNIDLSCQLDQLQLGIVAPFWKSLLLELSGIASGQVQVKGVPQNPLINGEVQLNNAVVRPAINNVRYNIDQQVLHFNNSVLELKRLEIKDPNRRSAYVDGVVDLTQLDSIWLDLQLEMEEFLVLNTVENDSVPYFGVLRVDASGTVQGPLELLRVDMTAKPAQASRLQYTYIAQMQELSESNGIVVFTGNIPAVVQNPEPIEYAFPFLLHMGLEMNDQLELQVVFNPLTRDMIKFQGQGDLQMNMSPNGAIELNGRCEVVKGSGSYTYQNLFKRNFEVVPGGTLLWTKDPANPFVDLSAYFTVRTSPLPILATDIDKQDTANLRKEVFWVVANVKDYLIEPDLDFQLKYPLDKSDNVSYGNSGNEDIVAAIDRINKTPEQLSLQVFNMMVFRTFSGQLNTANMLDIQAGINTMLANQLNVLTSDISWVDIDFELDDGGSSASNLQIKLKKSFLNNRLTVRVSAESTVEGGGAAASVSGKLDDLVLEYKINQNGTIKATAFSKQTFNDLFQGIISENGAGVSFEKEYDRAWKPFQKRRKDDSSNPLQPQ
jgi:hypothetical protein